MIGHLFFALKPYKNYGGTQIMTTLILTLLFVAIVAISALVGFVRGLSKSVIRIMTLILAIVFTFVLSGPLTALVADSIVIQGQTLGEMILESLSSTELMANILEAAPLMREAILVAPAFVIAIVIFPVAFLLLSFVSWIIFLCVQKPLRKLIFRESGKGVRIGKRLAGLGVGFVTGAIIFGMVMTPVFGLISVLPEQSAMEGVLDELALQGSISEADAELIKEEYAVTDSALIKFYSLVGATPAGRAYLNSVSKIEADGQVTYLADEFDSLLAVVQKAIEGGLLEALGDTENQDALYDVFANREFVNELMSAMFESKLLRSAVPEVMAVAMESMAKSLNVPLDKAEAIKDSIRETVKTAVEDSEKSQETAEALASVISNIAGAVSGATDENGNVDATKIDFGKVAEAIVDLQDSPIKDVGSSVLDIVASGDLGKNDMISSAIDTIKEGYESGNEEIGGAIASAGALVGLAGAAGGEGEETDKEATKETIKTLTENVNDFTVQLLPDILTSEALEDMGVPPEQTEATYDVFETLFKELSALNKTNPENYDNEVEATLAIYTIATSGSDKFGEEEVAKLIDYAEKSQAIANTLNSIEGSNPFGITISDAQKRADIIKVIEDNYNESGKTAEEKNLYLSVARVLGLEAEVKLD